MAYFSRRTWVKSQATGLRASTDKKRSSLRSKLQPEHELHVNHECCHASLMINATRVARARMVRCMRTCELEEIAKLRVSATVEPSRANVRESPNRLPSPSRAFATIRAVRRASLSDKLLASSFSVRVGRSFRCRRNRCENSARWSIRFRDRDQRIIAR